MFEGVGRALELVDDLLHLEDRDGVVAGVEQVAEEGAVDLVGVFSTSLTVIQKLSKPRNVRRLGMASTVRSAARCSSDTCRRTPGGSSSIR